MGMAGGGAIIIGTGAWGAGAACCIGGGPDVVWVTIGAAGAVMGGGAMTGAVGMLLALPPTGMVAVWVASPSGE